MLTHHIHHSTALQRAATSCILKRLRLFSRSQLSNFTQGNRTLYPPALPGLPLAPRLTSVSLQSAVRNLLRPVLCHSSEPDPRQSGGKLRPPQAGTPGDENSPGRTAPGIPPRGPGERGVPLPFGLVDVPGHLCPHHHPSQQKAATAIGNLLAGAVLR